MESGEKERLAAYSSSLEKASKNLLSVRLDALRNIQPTYRIATAQMEELEVQYISITKYSQEEFMVQEWICGWSMAERDKCPGFYTEKLYAL